MVADGQHAALDEGIAFVAIRDMCGIGKVDEVSIRQAARDGGQNRESTESAVKNADHASGCRLDCMGMAYRKKSSHFIVRCSDVVFLLLENV